MNKIDTIRAHQRSFLEQVKSRKEPTPYTIGGVEIIVNPGVFPPATDTKLLASHIRVTPQDRTLDITSGAGTFSVIAGLQGASGIAIDINLAAVRNSEENFKKFGVNMKAIQSDLFQNVPHELFDFIFANGPFFEGDISDPLDYACYGARSFTERLLPEVKMRLKPTGKLLMIVSEYSDLEHLASTIELANLTHSLVDTRQSDDGKRGYNLYAITL